MRNENDKGMQNKGMHDSKGMKGSDMQKNKEGQSWNQKQGQGMSGKDHESKDAKNPGMFNKDKKGQETSHQSRDNKSSPSSRR